MLPFGFIERRLRLRDRLLTLLALPLSGGLFLPALVFPPLLLLFERNRGLTDRLVLQLTPKPNAIE